MELNLTFKETEYLKRICSYSTEITFKIDISEQMIEYCKGLMEGEYKIFKNLWPKEKLKNDTLYQKLCKYKKENKNEKS
jgi:hypothetical protein